MVHDFEEQYEHCFLKCFHKELMSKPSFLFVLFQFFEILRESVSLISESETMGAKEQKQQEEQHILRVFSAFVRVAVYVLSLSFQGTKKNIDKWYQISRGFSLKNLETRKRLMLVVPHCHKNDQISYTAQKGTSSEPGIHSKAKPPCVKAEYTERDRRISRSFNFLSVNELTLHGFYL